VQRLIKVEQSGCHAPDGIFMAHGPRIAGPGSVTGARIIDLGPTILHLLGSPVPRDMDGRVLEEALQPGFLARNPIQYSEPVAAPARPSEDGRISDEDARVIEQRLRDIGYLD
jgi:hypothetical protein